MFKAELSQGDFVVYAKGKTVSSMKPEDIEEAEEDSGEDASGLLSCPVDGCVRTYQTFNNLERHLLFGKCKIIQEKHSLLDSAKLAYVQKVQESNTAQPTLTPATSKLISGVPLAQGWALRGTKKTTRFNESQRQYLDDKFQIGQDSGHKADPEMVSREMRYARTENGQRRFNIEEFLNAQQIQGYFSRAAAKLRHATASQSAHDDNVKAAQEEESYTSARAAVLDQCHPLHPIVYDNLNICSLYKAKKLAKLSIAQLRLICSHYNMDVEEISLRRKAPYINYIADLVGVCSCTRV